jgi:2-polyprenyl-6-methoxyphenol hydroxylase-like FAD-dependent oxidoreductase
VIFSLFWSSHTTPSFNTQANVLQIVGAGTAGLALASRLASNSLITVAVIEAGSFSSQDNGNVSQVPGYAAKYLTFNDLEKSPSLVDWGIITEPQKGLGGRRMHYVRGKSVGGRLVWYFLENAIRGAKPSGIVLRIAVRQSTH